MRWRCRSAWRVPARIIHAVRLDMPVRAVYEDVDDDLALVCFEPEEGI
jgi:hypothetical protein